MIRVYDSKTNDRRPQPSNTSSIPIFKRPPNQIDRNIPLAGTPSQELTHPVNKHLLVYFPT